MTRIFVCDYISVDPGQAATGLVEAGRRMRDAVAADLVRLDGLAVSCAVAGGETVGDARLQACRIESGESRADFMLRQAIDHDACWLIAPETDGILLGLCYRIGETRWIGSRAAAIAVATSKRATAERLADCGVVATRPWLATEGPPSADGPPPADGRRRRRASALDRSRWVVKPDDGAGSLATFVHDDLGHALAAWRARLAAGEPVILEPWFEGPALSLSLLCAAGRAELLSINRQQIRVDGSGQVHDDGVLIDRYPRQGEEGRRLASLASRIVEALPGLTGFVGVDLVWHERLGPVVIEINPRVTCAYVGLSERLGRNLACEVLASHQVAAEAGGVGAGHG